MTDSNTGALGGVIKAAVKAGIPVSILNAGADDAMSHGGIQEQGNSALEKRCDGVIKGAGAGVKVQRLYVNGQDTPAVTTAIQAKLTQDKSVDWVITWPHPSPSPR